MGGERAGRTVGAASPACLAVDTSDARREVTLLDDARSPARDPRGDGGSGSHPGHRAAPGGCVGDSAEGRPNGRGRWRSQAWRSYARWHAFGSATPHVWQRPARRRRLQASDSPSSRRPLYTADTAKSMGYLAVRPGAHTSKCADARCLFVQHASGQGSGRAATDVGSLSAEYGHVDMILRA